MLGGQQGEPVGHQRSQGRGYGAGPAQCHQLLDEERQPVGAVVEHRPRCGVGSAEGNGEPVHVGPGEALQPQRRYAGKPGERGRWRRTRLVLTQRGDHDDGKGRYDDRDVGEHGPGVGVGPVEVLEQQEARPAATHHAEEAGDRLTEDQARVDAWLRGRCPRGARPVREQPRERRPVGTERRGRHVESGPQRPDEGVGHGPVGPATFDRATGKDDVGCRRRRRELLEQAGLPDACLPGDEHEPAEPVSGLGQGPAQHCQLVVATDEGSAARGRSCHGDHSRYGGREARDPCPHRPAVS